MTAFIKIMQKTISHLREWKCSVFSSSDHNNNLKPAYITDRNKTTINTGRGRWAIYLLAGVKRNILYKYMCDFYYHYWKENSDPIDYFLTDYAIALAYDNIPTIREMIDTVPDYNADTHSLENNLNNEFSENEFAKYQSITFHKLSWKKNFTMYTKEGKSTIYNYLDKEYNRR